MKNRRYFLKIAWNIYFNLHIWSEAVFLWIPEHCIASLLYQLSLKQNCDHIQSAISYTSASFLHNYQYLVSIWTPHCLAYSFPIQYLQRLYILSSSNLEFPSSFVISDISPSCLPIVALFGRMYLHTGLEYVISMPMPWNKNTYGMLFGATRVSF